MIELAEVTCGRETWDSIRARRNVRTRGSPDPAGGLGRILEAAWRTPSSMNQQPWDFVVCTERRRSSSSPRHGVARHVAGSAATVVLVAPIPADQDSRDWIFYDMGQATMSMMLAAADLGIGSSHAALDDQALARRILGLPEDRSARASSRSATRPIGRSRRSSIRTGGRWMTSSTANAGEECEEGPLPAPTRKRASSALTINNQIPRAETSPGRWWPDAAAPGQEDREARADTWRPAASRPPRRGRGPREAACL